MMENQYMKTFPQLMAGKTVLYIHGFGSAGSTHTAQMLRQLMANATVLSPDIPLQPTEAIAMLHELVEAEKPNLIIGTSMGGMYTEQLKGIDRICVNPAFQMGETMQEHGMTGKQVYQNPRKDGIQEFIVTKALVKEYKAITELCFQNVDNIEQQRVYGLFGDRDEVVHTYNLFLGHYPNAIRFHGEHRLNDSVLLHYIVPVIRWIDDRQEGRERPSIYIDYSTVHDVYGKPRSCFNKAYEFLIENYNVFFTAPAPSADHTFTTHVQEWIEEYVSAPAWNHIVFTNQPEHIYGDYFIRRGSRDERRETREESRGSKGNEFLGTVLTLGSDDMKTWEEVITFFERLGGQ